MFRILGRTEFGFANDVDSVWPCKWHDNSIDYLKQRGTLKQYSVKVKTNFQIRIRLRPIFSVCGFGQIT